MNYIRKHWHGELSLAISFWVNFFLINVTGGLLCSWFSQNSPIKHPVIVARVLVFYIIFTLGIVPWQTVGLWRACNRHVAVNGRAFWARTAQVNVILSLVVTLGSIISFWEIYKAHYQIGFEKDTITAYTLTLKNIDSLIHLEGGLSFGVSKDVAALLKDHSDIKGIIIDSVGGRIYEGRELSKLILIYCLDTYSLKGCYSASTIAFISGEKRFLGTGANLGFHQYRVVEGDLDRFVNMKKEQEEDLRIFKRKGVKKEFLEKLYDTSHEDVWYPTIDELLSAGVIHGVVNPSDLTPVEYQESIEDVIFKEIFLDTLVGRTIQKYEPKVFEQIITDMEEQFKKGATRIELQQTGANHIKTLAERLIPMSSDETLIRFVQNLVDTLRKLVEKDPILCLKYIYPQQYGAFVFSEYLSHDELELANDVFRNIIIDAYEKESQPIDIEAAELQMQKILLELGDGVEYFDIDFKKLQNSENYKRHCDARIRFFDLILAEDRRISANILRYIFTQNESDGSKYDGDIVDGKKHGHGTYTWPGGDIYVGEWRDNMATGGWYYSPDGSKKWAYTDSQGEWKYQSGADREHKPTIEKQPITKHKQQRYELKVINGDKVVIDHTTGLMWHQTGSSKGMKWKKAKKWVKKLNGEGLLSRAEKGFAGYNDWRFPTVEEASSLLESSTKNGILYIDSVFDDEQSIIWTGDKFGSDGARTVDFVSGCVSWYNVRKSKCHIRPVRSGN